MIINPTPYIPPKTRKLMDIRSRHRFVTTREKTICISHMLSYVCSAFTDGEIKRTMPYLTKATGLADWILEQEIRKRRS